MLGEGVRGRVWRRGGGILCTMMSPEQQAALRELWDLPDGKWQCIELAAALSGRVRAQVVSWRTAERDHVLAYRKLSVTAINSDFHELALLNEEITRRRLAQVDQALEGTVQKLFGL